MATLWFCDVCKTQVKKNSYGAGKYSIQKTFYEPDPDTGTVSRVQRYMRLCDKCGPQLEAYLDDEFDQGPEVVMAKIDKRC